MPTPVPYSGTQSVTPQDRPASPVHIDTPTAAFGGAVADSIQHMGGVADQAGKELFDRAYAMQELNEHARASAQIAGYQDDLVKLRSDFSQYRGADAAAHLPDFINQTEELRQKYSGGLTSPYAKQLFDDESRSSRFRVIFSAGSGTDEELKRFNTESAQYGIAAAGHELAAANPFDPAAQDAAIKSMEDKAKLLATITGGPAAGTPGYNEFIREHVSKLGLRPVFEEWLKDPVRGDDNFEKLHKLGKISDDDYTMWKPQFDEAVRTKGVADIAAKLDAGGFSPGGQGPLPPATVMSILPKVSGTGGYETIGREDENGNGHGVGLYGVSSADLQMRLRNAGMPTMTEEAFLKNHDAQDQLARSFFADAQAKYGSFNEALRAWTGGVDTDMRVAGAQKEIMQGASYESRMKIAETKAKELNLDPIATDRLVKQTADLQAQREAILAKDHYTYTTAVNDALQGVGVQDGKIPTSRQELMALPGMAEAVARLNQTSDGKRYLANLQKALNANLARGGYGETEENTQLYNQLRGIAYDPTATREQREQLINTVPAALKMPQKWVNEIADLRKKAYDGSVSDPNMSAAMKVMEPLLKSVGYDKLSDPAKYEEFVGKFQAALKGEITGELRPVKDADTIRKIGMTLLAPNTKAQPGWLGLGSYPSTFESPGDTPSRAEAEQDVRKQLKELGINRDPTSTEVDKAVLLKQFMESGKSGKLTNRVPGQ